MSTESVNNRIAANESDFQGWAAGARVMGLGTLAPPNKALFLRLCEFRLPCNITPVCMLPPVKVLRDLI